MLYHESTKDTEQEQVERKGHIASGRPEWEEREKKRERGRVKAFLWDAPWWAPEFSRVSRLLLPPTVCAPPSNPSRITSLALQSNHHWQDKVLWMHRVQNHCFRVKIFQTIDCFKFRVFFSFLQVICKNEVKPLWKQSINISLFILQCWDLNSLSHSCWSDLLFLNCVSRHVLF